MQAAPTCQSLGVLRNLGLLQRLGLESIRNADIEANAPGLLWFGEGFNFAGASLTYGGIALILLATWVGILDETVVGGWFETVGEGLLAGISGVAEWAAEAWEARQDA